MYKLKVIIASTREGRKGKLVADWFISKISSNKDFEIEVLDLKEIDLPLMNEPIHPSLKNYQFEHTKKWSKSIDEADAFVVILPEYNFGLPATIKNALDYLYLEWTYKPMAIVSYGGISGGLRATQHLKSVVTTFKMMPMYEQVVLPFFLKYITDDEKFNPPSDFEKGINPMMNELKKWTKYLKLMREENV